MYLEHFGLREHPFTTAPDPRYYYPSAKHREALACLLYTVEQRKGFALITGEVGAGKTMLCRAALNRLGDEVETALIVHTLLSPMEFFEAVCTEFRLPAEGRTKVELINALRAYVTDRHQRGCTTVLLLDEAQDLSLELLEEVRLLGNLETDAAKLLQIILVGQPELRRLIGTRRLRALDQRIGVKFHLGPLSLKDVNAYIDHRLRVAGGEGGMFSPEAKLELYRASGGVPRVVNIICDQALLQAYINDERTVSLRTVEHVVSEMQGYYMDGRAEPDAGSHPSLQAGSGTGPEVVPPEARSDPMPRASGAGPRARTPLIAQRRAPALRLVQRENGKPDRAAGRAAGGSLQRPLRAPLAPDTGEEQISAEAGPQEPHPGTAAVPRFPSVDELCGAIGGGRIEVEYMPRRGSHELARYLYDGLSVAVRLVRAGTGNYTVLTVEVGLADLQGARGGIGTLTAELGYVKAADHAYVRLNRQSVCTLKVGRGRTHIACRAWGARSEGAVAYHVQTLHKDLRRLADGRTTVQPADPR